MKHNPYMMLCVMILCFSLSNHLSLGSDTISGSESLSGNQTIISSEGSFELGFFKPGNSSNFYIGMWYKKITSQTIVWVANRETPISNKYTSELQIINGNLVLLNESRTTVWSTNIQSTTTSNISVVATLQDDGNLILIDVSNSTKQPIWQSFDFPTDTWLPGSKIGYNNRTNTKQILTSWKNSEDPAPGLFSNELDPNPPNGTIQYLIQWNRSLSYWISGSWNGQIFSNVPEMRFNSVYNYSYVSNENESYFTYSLYNRSIISRFIMDVSGQIKQLIWVHKTAEWSLFWSTPQQQCEVYAYCGAFGICNQNVQVQPFCNCLHGFVPKSAKDWNLSDFSGGCVRKTSLQCGINNPTEGKKDRFWKNPHMGLPQADENSSVRSAVQCESICLNRCNCTAYANGISGCSIWYGEPLNVKQLSESVGTGETIYVRLSASEFPSHKNRKAVVIGLIIGSVAGLVAVMVLVIFWRWKNKQKGRNKSFKNRFVLSKRHANLLNDDVTQGGSSDVPFFELKSIIAATDGFSVANKLGQGGFGPVYKGNLTNGQKIAVKRLSNNSGQGMREFKNEVILISKLQHRNLVKLLGFCVEGDEKLLIYEYMPNKSLDAFLSGTSERGILEWDQRYNIIEGIARGLLYLHRDSRLKVIHRDLKPSNILLDEDMNPKISDFGMAKLFGGNQTLADTNRIVGTYGYMSPEYAMQGLFSEKSDVFSFGVLLLEIVSSKKNSSFYHHEKHLNLLGYVWQLWNEGKALEVLDLRLSNSKSPAQVMRCIHVGLLCVQEQTKDRPNMSTIVFMLCNEATLPTPKQPAFISNRDSTESDSPLTNNITCSTNYDSITTIGGR